MNGATLNVICVTEEGELARSVRVSEFVIAGWTGRDRAAIEKHIAELGKLGVPRPSTTPMFYRAAASLLTTSDIEVLGADTSGEVEAVLLSLEDGLWVGVGSDHTDRKAEATSVAHSKQLCPKPVGEKFWRLADVAAHWDELTFTTHVTVMGKRRLYQQGRAGLLLPPNDLARRWRAEGLAPGTAMFCGTYAAIGEIGPAAEWEISLVDPVRGRTIAHRYAVRELPVVA